jgi:hypothetical protein
LSLQIPLYKEYFLIKIYIKKKFTTEQQAIIVTSQAFATQMPHTGHWFRLSEGTGPMPAAAGLLSQ